MERRRPRTPRIAVRKLPRGRSPLARPATQNRNLLREIAVQLPALITALAAIGALVFTQQSLRATQEQLIISRNGQSSERFTKAIEQLGNKESIDVRVGSIYALERLAKDSGTDRPVIMEVLANFVRTRSPAVQQPDGTYACASEDRVPADIEAAVVVIGRRDRGRDENFVDLGRSCLRVRGANQADFSQTILYHSDFTGASLKQARFVGTTVQHARFDHAILYGANFSGVTGDGASFRLASLPNATFDRADLRGADFTGAYVGDSSFDASVVTGTKFEAADLTRVDFSKAIS